MPFFTHNNHQLHYREQGQGPLLLILPGNTASSAWHVGELAYFGRYCHVVALDLWGTGQSDRMDVWPDDWWAQGAQDAAALIRHLGQAPALVMGASGGGLTALLLAIQAPACVQAVVADSCVARLPAARMQNEVAARRQRAPAQIRFWQRAHGDDWEQVVEADSEFLLRLGDRGEDVFAGRLHEIRRPVLFTASLRDPALFDVGPQICAMTAQVADGQALLVNGGDHPLMWSRPEVFRRAADTFLQGWTAASRR